MLNEYLLHHARAVRQLVLPRRPGVGRERRDVSGTIWIERVRRIPLRRERERPRGCIGPGIETVHQNDPARRGRHRGEQQRVIPPRPHARRRARREPAEAVGLEPFRCVIDFHRLSSNEIDIAILWRA